jgi:hypothetical protein
MDISFQSDFLGVAVVCAKQPWIPAFAGMTAWPGSVNSTARERTYFHGFGLFKLPVDSRSGVERTIQCIAESGLDPKAFRLLGA